MNENADVPATTVSLRRASAATQVTEISAIGHPRISTTWTDGRLTLPATIYGRMQSRVFITRRADCERAALEWFRTQAGIWRALPPLPVMTRPPLIAIPDDQLPLVTGWQLSPDTSAADLDRHLPAWVATTASTSGWKDVSLGAFGTLGLANDVTGRFRTTVAVPPGWAGRQVSLVFDAEYWFWGLFPQSRLWINGAPSSLPQPMKAGPNPCFFLDVTVPAAGGTLVLALEIDGSHQDHNKAQIKPTGVTGIFYLEATPQALRHDPLAGPWLAAREFNQLLPLSLGGKMPEYVYLQTSFTLPVTWPSTRVYLEAEGPLGCLVLNNQLIETPAWMKRLDVTNLVRRNGVANVLRWSPELPNFQHTHHDPLPAMRLAWQP